MSKETLEGVTVYILEDHPAMREGLSFLLTQYGITVCGKAERLEEARADLKLLRPDLVMVDLTLKDEDGLALLEQLHDSEIKSLVYTMHDDPGHIEAAIAAGADGYVTKSEMADTLREAICAILAGHRYLSPAALEALQTKEPETLPGAEKLSERELDIFRLVGEGYTTTNIATALNLSVKTVETYYTRIIGKLDCPGVREMRRLAIKRQIGTARRL